WKTAQGHHHRRCQKARHHRERPVQEPSETDRRDGLKDTVAKRNAGSERSETVDLLACLRLSGY
ncbi:hypothetical protein, partial [Paracoccus rhizosphaerae]|uniref:hypothetical protein n=1 Tax=Paracoccus rhizosphaerae TaxID=1133347 RepID=UPI00223F733C